MGLAARQALIAAKVAGRGRLGRYGGAGVSETDRFEAELRAFAGTEHALAVNSGTSALVCALVGLGVGPDDEVLIPGYTFVATAAAVVAVGARPVLVEIDESLTIDPVDCAAKVTPATAAVIAVHMRNCPADIDAIIDIAERHQIPVIEDACQAAGVRHRGRPLGSIGTVGTFSFNQFKNMRAGEGGALLTNDLEVHSRAGRYHDVGSFMRVDTGFETVAPMPGLNLRMPDLLSSILRPQLSRIDAQMDRRAARRRVYVEAIGDRGDFRLAPHHSPDDAVAVAFFTNDPGKAKAAGSAGHGEHLRHSRGHVYDDWTPMGFDQSECPNTLEILGRAVGISYGDRAPLPLVRRRAAALAAAV